MADTDTRQRSRAASSGTSTKQDAEDRKPTDRVILKRERVIVLPEGVDSAVPSKLAEALGVPKTTKIVTGTAWVEVARTKGDKRKAIEAHAGEPNTPTAKPGVYKAPTVSAFAGGREYVKPPEPKVEAGDID